jgi:TonB family protein
MSLGHPLRWVLEFDSQRSIFRLTDTTRSVHAETTLQRGTSSAQYPEALAEFQLGPRVSLQISEERPRAIAPTVDRDSFGIEEQQRQFRKTWKTSIGIFAASVLALSFISTPKPSPIERAAVSVVDLAKIARSSTTHANPGSSGTASRLKSLIQGSSNRWLARTTTSTLSGKWSDRYTASFGNMAQSNTLGLSSLGKNGYSGSLGNSGKSGGPASNNWVNLDTLTATVEQGLTKDEVGEVIHRHMKEVRYCYETAMIRQPDIEGKLVVQFTIGSLGGVKSTGVRDSSVPDSRLDECIISRLAAWKFPQPKGGIEVAVTYPFIFKTLGK